jgi:hypothetical protein
LHVLSEKAFDVYETQDIDDSIEPILLVDDKDPSGFLEAIRESGIEI